MIFAFTNYSCSFVNRCLLDPSFSNRREEVLVSNPFYRVVALVLPGLHSQGINMLNNERGGTTLKKDYDLQTVWLFST